MILALSKACGKGMDELDWAARNRPQAFDALWSGTIRPVDTASGARARGETWAQARERIRRGRERNLRECGG